MNEIAIYNAINYMLNAKTALLVRHGYLGHIISVKSVATDLKMCVMTE